MLDETTSTPFFCVMNKYICKINGIGSGYLVVFPPKHTQQNIQKQSNIN